MKETKLTRIQQLYEKIPKFSCKEGCVDCCDNMIQFAPEEKLRLPCVEWNISWCPYLCDKGCSVYQNRGFICRIFGSSELFPCPYGYGPDKLLTKDETRELFSEFVRIKKKQETNIDE